MEKDEMIWIATVAIGKNMDYEKLKYSDYMYDKENESSNVWEYVEECNRIGTLAFKEKYKNFKLYCI